MINERVSKALKDMQIKAEQTAQFNQGTLSLGARPGIDQGGIETGSIQSRDNKIWV
jgi:hypothetical protein